MSFLTQFFSSDRSRAERLAKDDALLKRSIERYFAAYERKKQLFDRLPHEDDIREIAKQLHMTLADEMAMIAAGEYKEKDLRTLLAWFSHKQRAITMQRIGALMDHAVSQENYAFHLMKRLDSILRLQAYTLGAVLKKLEKGDRQQADALRRDLIDQFYEEVKVAEALKRIDVHTLYKNLALGARQRYEIDEKERVFAEQIYEQMMETAPGEHGEMVALTKDPVAQLTANCFNKLDQTVYEAVYDLALEDDPHYVYKFVNSHFFEDFVKHEAWAMRSRALQDQNLLRRFIIIFRDLYSSRIEREIC